ncbi:MAG TPA: S8 family serine peptidase, partial [Chitinophagales bacterium]|nr:S8 family serine peptidase [Chitinophagales bacterium]
MLFAKQNPEKYIVYFKDKPTNVDVTKLFNEKALQNRKKYNIPFDERDFSVDSNYIVQLKNINATILNTSNWLNASLISIDENDISNLENLPFVTSIIKVEKTTIGGSGIASVKDINECEATNDIQDFENNYSSSFPQVNLLKGEYLHEQGFNGENMTIAVCDNGFYNVNNNNAFTHIFNENRLLGTYDYVHSDSLVYDESQGPPNYVSHGSNCFSFIAGYKENQFIGTATKSNFYLFHTENTPTERLQEEFNLATALERCTQLGVNVVSISLGYTTFDVPSENHDTSDMRKNNTPSAKAVNMAVSKGLLVCVAAGNEGNSSWKYISSPSDADSAFCIASVDINGSIAVTSGYGLPNDPRVKPNVAAVGVSPYLINTSGIVGQFGGGTSYATPQIAGLAACLWQAFPTKTNWEIKTAIEQSASQYLTPDKRIGYGIPDFKKAYQLLSSTTYV